MGRRSFRLNHPADGRRSPWSHCVVIADRRVNLTQCDGVRHAWEAPEGVSTTGRGKPVVRPRLILGPLFWASGAADVTHRDRHFCTDATTVAKKQQRQHVRVVYAT